MLSRAITSALPPDLSPNERCHYESVLGSSNLGAYLAPVEDNAVPIVIDTGASRSISPIRADFTTFTKLNRSLHGISAETRIEGEGITSWDITDQNGVTSTVQTLAFYVPNASIRLYSPQYHFKECLGGHLTMDHTGIELTLPSTSRPLSFPFNESSNLPYMLPSKHPHFIKALFGANFTNQGLLNNIVRDTPIVESFDPVTSIDEMNFLLAGDSTFNLNSAQKELRLLHNKVGHIGMKRLQQLLHHERDLDSAQSDGELNHPVVFRSAFAKTRTCVVPFCRACALSKMTKQPTGSQHVSNDPLKEMALLRNDLSPGECVSTDQYVVPLRGRRYHTAGKERENDQYCGGTLFVDHASRHVTISHQTSLTGAATLLSKRQFERDSSSNGVRIKHYHADNGIFAAASWRDDCILKSQELTFSAANSHHQNGVAERYIQSITRLARAMLLHSALHWPKEHQLTHWPMAMDHAVWVWNNLPMADGMFPIEKFTGQKSGSYNHLRACHVWGSPCYVLDPKIVEGKKIPKWSPRSRQGKFMGYSKEHASNAGLLLNPKTGFMSVQYHVLYDDQFMSVAGVDEDQRIATLESVDWPSLIQSQGGSDIHYDDEDIDFVPDEVNDEWLTPEEIIAKQARRRRRQRHQVNMRRGAPNEAVIHLDDSDDDSEPADAYDNDGDDDNDDGLGPNEGAIDGIERNEGDDLARNEGDGLGLREGTTDGFLPNEGDTSPVARRTRSKRDVEPVARRTRSQRGAKDIWPFPSIDEARQQVEQDMQRRQHQRTARTREARPTGQFYSMDHVHFSSHEGAEQFGNRKLRGNDLHGYEFSTINWGDSLSMLAGNSKDSNGDSSRYFASMDVNQDPLDLTLDEFPTLGLASKAAAEDNPNFGQAMNGPNAEGFWDASVKEISTLQKLNSWTQVKRLQGMNVIQSTWAYKIKRFPDGLVRKLKARFCVRGDMQIEGVDFFNTFAPVVQWATVRLLLNLSITLKLATVQVDYVSAFCQAPIDEDVYVELPRGWQTLNSLGIDEKFKKDHVLKLNQSLYGLRQSPRNFFMHLKSNLERVGFRQSTTDPCLFISAKVVCCVYVDDCLFFSPKKRDIDSMILKIKESMDLEVEDSVGGFLGILIERSIGQDGNEQIKLLQTGLIDRIISALGLDGEMSNSMRTPAPEKPLPKDPDGEPHDLGFNYASVVGMAMYLCNNSRPDITFAVHQCARHSFNPKRMHAEYLKKLGRYLIKTRTDGLIMRPDVDHMLKVDCYVDADFAGLWNSEDDQDPHCVKSRTGYVINVGGSPIIWSSKLQTLIASSTMEAEYIAMSTVCRELIPLRDLIKEVAAALDVSNEDVASMHTTIWEDNVGALTLARMELPRMTPRSKHIAVRYHWFRQYVSADDGKDGGIVVKKIGTKDQLADIFTKGLGPMLFEGLRKELCGW